VISLDLPSGRARNGHVPSQIWVLLGLITGDQD
jgi:hypothetical protein